MVPCSDPYPGYYCMTRKARGVDACPMLPVPKRIDDAVLDYFTTEALDVEATRRQIEEAFERRIAEARARREHAEREAMRAEERMRRVKRAFQDGNLDAHDWREQRRELTAERDAAELAVTNAIEHEQRVRTEDALTDAEEAALRRLAAIRDAVTGVQSDPTRTDGFRATLQRLFSGFTLHWLDEEAQRVAVAEPPRYWQPECLLSGGLYIEPHVRPESIAIAGVWPTLKRVALDGNTEAEAFSVDYSDRSLNRLTTAFRIFTAIPIAILAATIEGGSFGSKAGGAGARYAGGAIAILVIPVALMLLSRRKYPRWWFDWNLQLTRFSNRIAVYFALMDDRYPSTDEEQAVHLDFPYPDAEHDLLRGRPLVKWLLAIPHYIVLFFLTISALFAAIFAGSRSWSPAATHARCLTSSRA